MTTTVTAYQYSKQQQQQQQHHHHHQQQLPSSIHAVTNSVRQMTMSRIPMEQANHCSTPNCSCDCFTPGKSQMRICDNCNHGWISHVFDNLLVSSNSHHSSSADNMQASMAFEIASLIFYGTNALPVRLKILLDRILHILDKDELLNLLHSFGWTYNDYSRGYMLQDTCGNLFTRWSLISKEEELLILKLFLRFSETRTIAQNFVLQDTAISETSLLLSSKSHNNSSQLFFHNNNNTTNNNNSKRDSDLRRFIEKTSKSSISSLIKQSINSKHHNHNHSINTNKDVINLSHTTSTPNSGRPIIKHELHQKSMASLNASLMNPNPMSPNEKKLSSSLSSVFMHNSRQSPPVLSPLNKLQNMQPFDYRKSNEATSKLASIASDIPVGYAQNMTPTLLSPTTSSFPFVSSGLPIITTAVTTNNISSSISTNMTSTTNSNISINDCLSDDNDDTNTSGVINLSQTTSSAFAMKKVKHLRKSANPMKRRWNNPMIMSGLVTNPSTGKKRVQCHVCMKTFCDKGALKIHFSAVHLREMHKCTVDGCSMMFSSRRSRNRHSANPNPKLHTPNFRRKINPHDGRSAYPFPHLSKNSSTSLLNLSSNNLIGQNMDGSNPLMDTDLDKNSANNLSFNLDCDSQSLSPFSSCGNSDTSPMMTQMMPTNTNSLSKKSSNKSGEEQEKNGSPEEGIDLSLKEDFSTNKRKRKSLNPIKFAPIAMIASDDDIKYELSDDSSSDTYIDRMDDDDDNDNQLLDDSKSDFDSSDEVIGGEYMDNLLLKEKKDVENKVNTNNSNNNNNINKEIIEYDMDGTIDLSKKSRSSPPKEPVIDDIKQPKNKIETSFTNKMNASISSTHESSVENPLRHLESLSMGSSFTNLMNASRNHHKNHSLFSPNSMHSLSFHAPGLGLNLRPPTPPSLPPAQQPISKSSEKQTNAIIKESEYEPTDMNAGSPHSPNSNPSGLDMDSCMSDHVSMMPSFRESSFMGQIDVPVDKENPRRCTACGKIFQNHFGVKTHYQNVHLKVMHKCTVDGCNASFPSKRSRDRHSANLNLHRKLLSTHSDPKSVFGMDKSSSGSMFPFPNSAIREDFLSRLYDPQGLPLNLNDIYSRLPPIGPDGLFASAAAAAAAASFPVMPGFHPAMCLPPLPPTSSSLYLDTRSSVSRESPNSIRTTPSPSMNSRSSPTGVIQKSHHRISSPSNNNSVVLESVLIANDSGRYVCMYCQCCKSDASLLRDHYERVHKDILYRCVVHGCNKAFLDKKSKKKHIQFHSPPPTSAETTI
ncbi:zinc finger protein basonuclin-2-like [Oppia nitens]|uniref:zinc finger protein basonuclin-2-like n=1 Tax=Oppia nitens TaxID=1686743 RepID=UPI0023DAF244|nr:zinc finger protein basonuclin-2-like [Oppia nitens]